MRTLSNDIECESGKPLVYRKDQAPMRPSEGVVFPQLTELLVLSVTYIRHRSGALPSRKLDGKEG